MIPRLASNLSAVAALLSSDDARELIKKARSSLSSAKSSSQQPSAITNILLLQFPAPLSPPLRKKRGRPPNPSSLPHRVSHTMNISVNASPSHGLPSAELNSNRIVQQGQPDFFTPLMRVSPTNRSELRPRKQRSRKSTPLSFPTPPSPSFASMSPSSASRLHQVLQQGSPHLRPGLEPSAIDGAAFMNSLDPQHQFYITPPHLAKLLAEAAALASASASGSASGSASAASPVSSSSLYPKSSGPSLVRRSIGHRTSGSMSVPPPTSLTGDTQYHSFQKDSLSQQPGYNAFSHKKALSVASSVTDVSDIDSFVVPSRLRSGSSYYDHGLSTPSMQFGTPSNRRLRLPPQPADDLLPPVLFAPPPSLSQASPRPSLDFSLSLMVDALGKAALFSSNADPEGLLVDRPAQAKNMMLDESMRRSASLRMDAKRSLESFYDSNRDNTFTNQSSLSGHVPNGGPPNLDSDHEMVGGSLQASVQQTYEAKARALNHDLALAGGKVQASVQRPYGADPRTSNHEMTGGNVQANVHPCYDQKSSTPNHDSSQVHDLKNGISQPGIPADKSRFEHVYRGSRIDQLGIPRSQSQVIETAKDKNQNQDHQDNSGRVRAQSDGQVNNYDGNFTMPRGVDQVSDQAPDRKMCSVNRRTQPSAQPESNNRSVASSKRPSMENRFLSDSLLVRPAMDNRFMSESALVRPNLQHPQIPRRQHSDPTDTSASSVFPGNLECEPKDGPVSSRKTHSMVDSASLQNSFVETPQTPTTKEHFFYSSPSRNMQFAFTPLFNMGSTPPQGNGQAHHQQPSSSFLMSQELFPNRPHSSSMAHNDQIGDQAFKCQAQNQNQSELQLQLQDQLHNQNQHQEFLADQHTMRGGFAHNIGFGDEGSQFKSNDDPFLDSTAAKAMHAPHPAYDGNLGFEYASPSSMPIHHLDNHGEYEHDHQIRSTNINPIAQDDARLALKKVMRTRK